MKRYTHWMVAFVFAACSLLVTQSDIQAQEGPQGDATASVAGTSVGGFLGYDLDMFDSSGGTGAAFVGADALVGIDLPDVAPGFGLGINPALSFYFISDITLLQIDANILAQFAVAPEVTIYGGIGPAIHFFRVSNEFGSESDTEVNFNLFVGGASFPIDEAIDGFGQVRLTRFSEGQFSTTFLSLMGGVRFGM